MCVISRRTWRYLGSVEDVDDLRQNRVVSALVLLADELDVTQLSEVKVPLPLQPVYCHLQVHQLHVWTEMQKPKAKFQ